MNNNSNFEIIKINNDIEEIKNLLNNFDRSKSIETIKKHNATNLNISVINSPFNPGFVTFENATDDMIKNNLLIILNILQTEYTDKTLHSFNP